MTKGESIKNILFGGCCIFIIALLCKYDYDEICDHDEISLLVRDHNVTFNGFMQNLWVNSRYENVSSAEGCASSTLP